MSGDTAEPKAGLRSYALSTLSIAVILIAWESVARAKLVPELLVSDIGTSIEFWCKRLGFAIAYQRPEEKFIYLAWIIHERVATVVPERDRRVVFGGVGDAVIEV